MPRRCSSLSLLPAPPCFLRAPSLLLPLAGAAAYCPSLPSHAAARGRGQRPDFLPLVTDPWVELLDLLPEGTYTLPIALEAAQMSRLQVEVNGATRKGSEGVFNTPKFGNGSAIARHGDHGMWWSFEFPIKWYLLMEGENTISITQLQRGAIIELLCREVVLTGQALQE